jgi:DNA-binding GntR family transcriptional regulator
MPSEGQPFESLADFRIDRGSPVPLYFQVSQHFERAIESGEIPNGTLFDNEILLSERLGVSRPTMRRAMQYLVEKGLVVRRQGIGTRVVLPKVRRPLELTSLYDDLVRSGQRPTTKVLEIGMVEADHEVASGLGCAVGAEVLRVVRLRSAKHLPIAKMTNYLPERVGPITAEALEENGLYALMRARGLQLHSATQSIGARNATASEARQLDEPNAASVLTMQRISYDDHGEIVEFATHLYAASRYSFEINLFIP